jgi:ADP-ribose pyrophosphatase
MERIDSKVVYEGKIATVRINQYRYGDGSTSEREVVEHPGAVAIVAVDADDLIVLVRQLREPARKELLELPAGTTDEGEEPLATAQRELAEETGLRGGEWRHVSSFWTTPGFCRELMHVFIAEGVEAGEAAPAEDEELELVRVSVAELDRRLDELEDAKTLAGVLLYLRSRTV